MPDLPAKEYIIIVQCHIVQERCSGYFCEQALAQRAGGFAAYPADKSYRHLSLTCGGCCGRALQRKLSHACAQLKKHERIDKVQVIVQLSSCITRDNHHGPRCPHLDYLRALIARLDLDVCEDTKISGLAEKRRAEGTYAD